MNENGIANYYTNDIGSGIFINIKGENINICEGKYIELAANAHMKIADILIAACSGHSGFKWILNKVADKIFKNPDTD